MAVHLVQTSYYLCDPNNVENEMPCIGSVIARVRGAVSPALPPFVSIPSCLRYQQAGWLGRSYNPFETVRGPAHNQGLAALVSGLQDRGLDRDVLLVVMGKFGRTPKMNDQAGRDHWASVMSTLMSGGGLKVGQIVDASNSKGDYPISGAYRPENVLAMIYRHLGIDPWLKFPDPAGCPRYVLERREMIPELL